MQETGFKTPWTFREGELSPKHKTAIQGLAKVNRSAALIFVAGELPLPTLGELGSRALLAANETVDEPLFVLTEEGTIRMTRFNPPEVWGCAVQSTSLTKLFDHEVARIGLDPLVWATPSAIRADTPADFYEQVFHDYGYFDTWVPGDDPTAMYLNALTLFRKPLLNDIPASLFFSSASWPERDGSRRNTEARLLAVRDELWDKTSRRLTNDEIDFLTFGLSK